MWLSFVWCGATVGCLVRVKPCNLLGEVVHSATRIALNPSEDSKLFEEFLVNEQFLMLFFISVVSLRLLGGSHYQTDSARGIFSEAGCDDDKTIGFP